VVVFCRFINVNMYVKSGEKQKVYINLKTYVALPDFGNGRL